MLKKSVIILGGGAAGIFGAIRIKEKNPLSEVIILEKTQKVLSKVKISGGGRCNVTHNQFQPKELVKNYPRGEKELLGPFHHFQPKDMIEWLEERGVSLKTEHDGRIFPSSDSSQTIIDCFLSEIKNHQIQIHYGVEAESLEFLRDQKLKVLTNKDSYIADTVLIATGSNPKTYEWLKKTGFSCIDLVPSLFTFDLDDHFLKDLAGTSFPYAELSISDTNFRQLGPVLITHVGLSGPCALKLSAFAALYLKEKKYHSDLLLNIDASTSFNDKVKTLNEMKQKFSAKQISTMPPFRLTKATFLIFLKRLNISEELKWAHLKKEDLEKIAKFCNEITLKMIGKSTFKDEFVTAGGIDLKTINLKTMEHKNFHRVFFAGEVLNIDGITGGFNFQNAWTSATICAEGMVKYLSSEEY